MQKVDLFMIKQVPCLSYTWKSVTQDCVHLSSTFLTKVKYFVGIATIHVHFLWDEKAEH